MAINAFGIIIRIRRRFAGFNVFRARFFQGRRHTTQIRSLVGFVRWYLTLKEFRRLRNGVRRRRQYIFGNSVTGVAFGSIC